MKRRTLSILIASLLSINSLGSYANSINNMEFEFLSNNTDLIKIGFLDNFEKPRVIDSKSNEIHLVFNNLTSEMKKEFFNVQNSNIKNINIEEIGENTHVRINLIGKTESVFSYLNKKMIIELNKKSISHKDIEELWQYSNELKIKDAEFARHNKEHADIILSVGENDLKFDTINFENGVEFIFSDSSMLSKLFQKIDVSEYSTPVDSYLMSIVDGDVSLKIFFDDKYNVNYTTTKVDDKFIIVVKGENTGIRKRNNENGEEDAELEFNGELISFDFQDIPVKNALFLLAKKMNLNLVVGDNIKGRLALTLKDVPTDQALDIILRTKGLGKYVEGNVLLIAPLEEIAKRQEFELSTNQKISQISALKSDTIQIKYAKSSDVFNLLTTIKSNRGNIIYDERTNKMFIEDTAKKLFEMKNLVDEIDIPVRQVSVEARIVYAQKGFNSSIGVDWNAGVSSGTDWVEGFTPFDGGSLGIKEGSSLGGTTGNTASITLGFLNANIDATLTALENSGDVEIIARPLIIAANKKKSRISSGQEYPYIELSDNGDATTAFKEIVLSLDVTPQITPNDKLILDLEITQDSIAELTDAGPALDSTKIFSQVIVSNNQTLVLGGVFKDSIIKSESKVPLLGDIPFLGKLFRSETNSTEQVELLIFITPRILDNEELIRK